MEKSSDFQALLPLVGPQDAVLLADGSGNLLFSKNEHKPLVPASILKLLTSLAVMHQLGEDFRFRTDFYRDSSGNLIIKGYGDPLLISQEILKISEALAGHLTAFKDLVLDDSFFGDPLMIPGVTSSLQPYDAPNGALCANFNTIYFKTRKSGGFVSAEPHTPLLPMVIPAIKRSGLKEGRILITNENRGCTQFAGQIFLHHMVSNQVACSGNIRTGVVDPSADRLILTHTSAHPLTYTIKQLLQYSSNFIANQLLLAASARAFSEPANLNKAVAVLQTYAWKELDEKNIVLTEGSGISRGNQVTAAFMLKVLNRFFPFRDLMRKEGKVYYKTGTLTGVRSRAGYIETEKGDYYRFVIIMNTPGKSDRVVLNRLVEMVNPS